MEENNYLPLILIILLVIISLILLLFSYSFDVMPNANTTEGKKASNVLTQMCSALPETSDMGQEYINRITFLGESTTYGLARYGLVAEEKLWTGASCPNGIVKNAGTLSLSPSIDQTRIFYSPTNEAITIGEAMRRDKPEILIITLGLNNGAAYYSEEEFKHCYGVLLQAARDACEQTTIVLQSLFPVARSCTIKAFTPERISLCNLWIRELAFEYELYYLDTASILKDEHGYLFPAYDNGGDGIHLNKEGLTEVLTYIRTHGILSGEDIL